MVLTLNFNLYDRGGYGREKIDLCLCMVSEDPCWCRLEDDGCGNEPGRRAYTWYLPELFHLRHEKLWASINRLHSTSISEKDA